MNKRVAVKKNYFSFLSDLSDSRIVRIGLYLAIGIAALLLGWFVFISVEIEASTIFGILALFIIPITLLTAVFIGLEKITGISCLRGVEWVGKITLQFFGWVILNIQKWCGIETNDTPHSAQPETTPDRLPPSISSVTEVAAKKAHTDEPVLDFEGLATEDPLLDPLEYKQTLFQETPKPPVENISVEQPIINKEELTTSSISIELPENESNNAAISASATIGIDNTGDEQAAVSAEPLPPIKTIDTQQNINPIDERKSINSTVEQSVTEHNNKANSIPPIALINEKTDKQPYFSAEPVDIQHSLNQATEIRPVNIADEQAIISDTNAKPANFSSDIVEPVDIQQDIVNSDKSEINHVEREIKSLFQEEQNWINAEADNTQQIKPNDTEELISSEQKEPRNGVSFNIRSLFEKVGNNIIDSVGDENSADNTSKLPEVTVTDNNQTVPTDDAVENTENNTLLSQAEQTTADILSAFSEKLSSPLSEAIKPEYHLPSIELLQTHPQSVIAYSDSKLDEMSRTIERVLEDYKINAEVVGADPGPIITRFELLLAPGVKVSRVSGLAKDLARTMLVSSVRVVEIIEGTPYIGLEIPNKERELVSFREIIASEKFQQAVSPLTLALGKDVSGQTVVSDLGKMPHLLVAGTTGSGKSVAINTMILSMLYKATPEQVRMIMIDPKMLELSVYEGIPHLLTPVVTDMKEAQNALRWAVAEMERRYKLLAKVGVRNLAGFNQKIEEAAARGETIRDPSFQLIDPLKEGESFPVLSTLPSIVIVIDELADMMMIVGKKVEELIARLAQKARAAGIHLVLATQRPSVDVLTGLIKANVPTRISFQVSSRIDSRTILDQGGAETLLGNGDMLFLPSGTNVPIRSHGAFVDDDEVHAIVDYLKTLGGANYITEITQEASTENAAGPESVQAEVDELYPDAVSFVLETGRASISSVQRRFKVGYNRAARMIDQMEEENIVSEPEGNGSRRVLNRKEE